MAHSYHGIRVVEGPGIFVLVTSGPVVINKPERGVGGPAWSVGDVRYFIGFEGPRRGCDGRDFWSLAHSYLSIRVD